MFQKKIFLQNCTNWNILQRSKIFHLNWNFFHFGGKFSTYKNVHQKKNFFAELHELEHSAEGTFFRKIGNFSTFSKNSKIRKIYLFGPTTGQSFSKNYFLQKWASK